MTDLARANRRNIREIRECLTDFELRDVPSGHGTTLARFTGYACVTGKKYDMRDRLGEYTESVSPGAFAKTLRDSPEGPDVSFLVNHEGLAMARSHAGNLKLAEHTTGPTTGLYVEANLDRRRTDVQDLLYAIDTKSVDAMSFAFRVTRQRWLPGKSSGDGEEHRQIDEVNLHQGDVSVVNQPASLHTMGTVDVRQRARRGRGRLVHVGFVPDSTIAARAAFAATVGTPLPGRTGSTGRRSPLRYNPLVFMPDSAAAARARFEALKRNQRNEDLERRHK